MRQVMLFILLSGVMPAFSQVSVTPVSYLAQGQVYTQSFDGLPGSGTYSITGKGPFNLANAPFPIPGLPGWQFFMHGGTNANAAFLVSTGSATGNGVQSLGTTGSPDRALGSLSTGSAIYAIGILFSNNSGITLNSITLTFTVEQWRKGGSGNKNTWSFHYKTGLLSTINTHDLLEDAHFNFSSVITTAGAGSLNGNLPENRQNISYTLTGITWKPGEQLLLRWDDADENGNDDACAIDDLQFSAEQVEDLPSVMNKPLGINNDHTVQFNHEVNDNNSPTDLIIEYDTAKTFLSAVTVIPQPDHIVSGTGNTTVTGWAANLKSLTRYYYRLKATNRNGTTTGTAAEFISPAIPDTSPPHIYYVTIPDKPMKTGDTIPVTIFINSESSLCRILNSHVNGFSLAAASKKNDSTYTSYFVISNGGRDITAKDVIPLNITISDSTGNSSNYTVPVVQDNDALDANRPMIKRLQNIARTLYKANDTVWIVMQVSEPVTASVANSAPSARFTIGNTSRTATYLSGSGTDSLVFMYVIQATDEDSSGCKLPSSITLNNSTIRDDAGNNLLLNIPAYTGLPVRIDGISPKISSVAVPAAGYYKANDTLSFVVNFTEKIIVNTSDTVRLKITIGSSVKELYGFDKNETLALLFRYIIQKNDLDKTGITLGSITTTASATITDTAGNPCILTIKNAGSLANVKVDAVVPVFNTQIQSDIFACKKDTVLSITDALLIADEEKGDSLTLQLQSLHQPSSLLKNTFTFISNGSKISPGKINYFLSQTGQETDTLLATASDGINETKKVIRILIHPEIVNNAILPDPYLCSGTAVSIKGTEPSGGNGYYEYVWEYTNTNDSLHFIKLPGVNSLKDLGSSPKLSAVTFFRRKVISGTCSDTSMPVKIIPLKAGIWFGDFTNEWNNPNNWCNNIVPGPNTDVYIPVARNQPVIQDTASFHDIILGKNATLTVNGNVNISGGINGYPGSINLTKGKLTANGSLVQKIPSNYMNNQMIKDLLVSNPAGVRLSDTLFLSGVLRLINGSLETGNRLFIKRSGSIGQSVEGTAINGDVSFEQRITGKKGFRLMGHPFTTDILLADIVDSVYCAITPKDAVPINMKWTIFQNPWKKYAGIRVLADSNFTLQFTGPVNTGDQEIFLEHIDSISYHLTANPYASTIDLSQVSPGADMGTHFWVWDINQGDEGGYTSIPFQSKYLLAPFGAFFVKTTGLKNNTILFTENCKTTEMPTNDIPVLKGFADHHIELRLKSGNIFMDRVLICHSDSAWVGIDKFDAEKFMNSGINFYSLSREKKMLSVDFRAIKNTSVINLGIIARPGSYTLQIPASKLSTENTLQLHDRYLNKWMVLEKDSSYPFIITEDSLTSGNNRFEIISPPDAVDATLSLKKITLRVGPVPAKNEIMVYYAIPDGATAFMRILDQHGITKHFEPMDGKINGEMNVSVNGLLPGFYFVEIKAGKYLATQKFIKL